MKKVLGFVFILVVCVFLAGCDKLFLKSNTVTCSKEYTEDNVKTSEVIKASFSGEHLVYFVGNIVYEFENESIANLTYSYMSSAEDLLENIGFDVDSKLNGNKITMIYEGDMEEISKNGSTEELTGFDYDYDTNQASFVEEMQEEGFSCK